MEHQATNDGPGLTLLVYHRDPCRATLRARERLPCSLSARCTIIAA